LINNKLYLIYTIKMTKGLDLFSEHLEDNKTPTHTLCNYCYKLYLFVTEVKNNFFKKYL
jgi:hypothetical protein